MNTVRNIYFTKLINENANIPTTLYQITGSQMGSKETINNYPDIPDQILCDKFSKALQNKVTNTLQSIFINLTHLPTYLFDMSSSHISNSSFYSFSSPTLELISYLISSNKSTSYIDPVPLRIFKQFSSYISYQLLPI